MMPLEEKNMYSKICSLSLLFLIFQSILLSSSSYLAIDRPRIRVYYLLVSSSTEVV
jgi:hypothetical protein